MAVVLVTGTDRGECRLAVVVQAGIERTTAFFVDGGVFDAFDVLPVGARLGAPIAPFGPLGPDAPTVPFGPVGVDASSDISNTSSSPMSSWSGVWEADETPPKRGFLDLVTEFRLLCDVFEWLAEFLSAAACALVISGANSANSTNAFFADLTSFLSALPAVGPDLDKLT